MKVPSRFWLWLACLAGAATLGVVLYLFPPDRYAFYPRCAFYTVTGLKCPGCGGLRAAHELLHGHILNAFNYNPLIVLLPPVIGVVILAYRLRFSRDQQRDSLMDHPGLLWGFVGIVLAFAVLRNFLNL